MAKYQISSLIVNTMIAKSCKLSEKGWTVKLYDGSVQRISLRRMIRYIPVTSGVHITYLAPSVDMHIEGEIQRKYKLPDGTVMVELFTERNGLMCIPSTLCKELDNAA